MPEDDTGGRMLILAAIIYWTIVFAGGFLAALLAFTILDWILDR